MEGEPGRDELWHADLKNLGYARGTQRFLIAGVVSGVGGIVVGLASGDWTWAIVGPYLVALHTVSGHVLPRYLGVLAFQSRLRAEPAGLCYGDDALVPWVSITAAEVKVLRRGRSREILRAPGWRRKGFGGRLEKRHGLPLSVYDENWRDNADFVEVLRRHLPRAARETLRL